MNTKIFNFLVDNLNLAFSLPKYKNLNINGNTRVDYLPWTPARYNKFKTKLDDTFNIDIAVNGTLTELTQKIDEQYLLWFFGEIWKPKTEKYQYTGWPLVDAVNKHNPSAVLDVGCGYNQFKERIPNLTGIDPYNNCADYMVDILDYKVEPESYDAIIALGSINFNSQEDIEARVAQCVNLLNSNGRIYFRANPGIDHKNGAWVHIFPWSFEKCYEIAKKFNLKVETFKKDQDRLYWIYQKS